MNTRRASAPNRLLFALLAMAMVAMALLLPKLGYFSSNRSVTEIGVLLGFTVELPLYFWFFVLRRKGNSPLYAVPVAAMGYAVLTGLADIIFRIVRYIFGQQLI